MRGPAWQHEGDDPDYRFTLANERTFLAWIRTALALLAGGVLLHQFAATLEPRVVLVSVSVALGLIAAALLGAPYTRGGATGIAMRRRRRLPYWWVGPGWAGGCVLTVAVLTFLLLVS